MNPFSIIDRTIVRNNFTRQGSVEVSFISADMYNM